MKLQVGDNIQKVCAWRMRGRALDDAFCVVTPRVELTFDAILPFVTTNFVLRLKEEATSAGLHADGRPARRVLVLRGPVPAHAERSRRAPSHTVWCTVKVGSGRP